MRARPALLVGVIAAIAVAFSLQVPEAGNASGPANQIDYVAGGFTGNGDGGPATSAGLTSLWGVANDGAGTTYVSEFESCRIRRIVGGVITTYAGTGVCGYGAEGVPANSTPINAPTGVALDPAGNLYFAESTDCRIRKIDTSGVITTVVALTFCADGGDGGPAIDAKLKSPTDVAIDAVTGDMYIADQSNCKVKRVSGGIITTIAGTGTCGYSGDGGAASSANLNYPAGVYSDGAGNVYIADIYNYRVRKVTGGVITTVAGTGTFGFTGDGGPATSAQIGNTQDLFVSGGVLYLADEACRLRKVQAGVITTIAGTGTCGRSGDGGPATAAKVMQVYGVHVTGGGDVYISGGYGVPTVCTVRKVTGGIISTVAGTGHCGIPNDGGSPSSAVITPRSFAFDAGGNLLIGDEGLCRIRRLTGGALSLVTADQDGAPYICPDSGDGGSLASAQLRPHAMATSASGDLFIASDCRIRKVSAGIITTIAGTGVCGSSGNGGPALSAQVDYAPALVVDAAGANVYFIDFCQVRRVNAGTITAFAGTGTCSYNSLGGPATTIHLYQPQGLAVGPDGALFISDTRNCLIRKVKNGVMSLVAGAAPVDDPPFPSCGSSGDGLPAIGSSVQYPGPMVVDANYNIMFAEGSPGCRLRIIANGYINTFANTAGTCAYAGDGGPAAAANLSFVQALALKSDGDLYVGDSNRVRVIHATDYDGDAVLDGADNCVFAINGGQENADANLISNAPQYVVNDLTRTVSDRLGDACDDDDDGDGYGDFLESDIAPGDSSHAAWCPAAFADTDPTLLDTDGDRVTDAAECRLGSDPASASSVPPLIVAPDADSDGVPDFYDPNDADTDADDDGLLDRIEFRYYASTLDLIDSDGDGVKDGCEAASLNVDTIVNSIDQGLLAGELLRTPPPAKLVNFDINKDGALNSIDQGIQATRFFKCP